MYDYFVLISGIFRVWRPSHMRAVSGEMCVCVFFFQSFYCYFELGAVVVVVSMVLWRRRRRWSGIAVWFIFIWFERDECDICLDCLDCLLCLFSSNYSMSDAVSLSLSMNILILDSKLWKAFSTNINLEEYTPNKKHEYKYGVSLCCVFHLMKMNKSEDWIWLGKNVWRILLFQF